MLTLQTHDLGHQATNIIFEKTISPILNQSLKDELEKKNSIIQKDPK